MAFVYGFFWIWIHGVGWNLKLLEFLLSNVGFFWQWALFAFERGKTVFIWLWIFYPDLPLLLKGYWIYLTLILSLAFLVGVAVNQCSSSLINFFCFSTKEGRDGGCQTGYVIGSFNYYPSVFKLVNLLYHSYSFHHMYMKTISFRYCINYKEIR